MNRKNSPAFTLIELLVVIAIISLLSSIVLASISSARQRAKITRIVTDFQQIEKGMVMWMQGTGKAQWPVKDAMPVSDLSGLDQYLNSVPKPPYGTQYRYFNPNPSGRVEIYSNDAPMEIAKKVDQLVDGEIDASSGKINWESDGDIFYRLSSDNSF